MMFVNRYKKQPIQASLFNAAENIRSDSNEKKLKGLVQIVRIRQAALKDKNAAMVDYIDRTTQGIQFDILANAYATREINLEGASLENANFLSADFYKANLKNASLVGAVLQNIKLTSANLEGADMRDACIRCARISGAKLKGAKFNKKTLLHTEYEVVDFENRGAILDEEDPYKTKMERLAEIVEGSFPKDK